MWVTVEPLDNVLVGPWRWLAACWIALLERLCVGGRADEVRWLVMKFLVEMAVLGGGG